MKNPLIRAFDFVSCKANENMACTRHFIIVYYIAIILPLLLLVLFVQSNYLNRLQNGYQDVLEGYVSELRDDMDSALSRMEEVVHSIVSDNEIETSYSPAKPVAVMRLNAKLKEYCQRIDILNEVIVYGQFDEYMFSNLSSYEVKRFASSRKLTELALDADMSDYLLGATVWQTLKGTYNGAHQILLIYPWVNPSKPVRVFIFVIDENKLLESLKGALKDNTGSVSMLDERGMELLRYGEADTGMMVATAQGDVVPFSYVMHVQAGSIVNDLKMLRFIWCLILGMAVGLGLCEAILLARYSNKPMRKLRQKLCDYETLPENDYEALYLSIEDMQSKLASLQKCSQIAQAHFIDKLLRNDMDTSAVLRILSNAYNLPASVFEWQVAVVVPAPKIRYMALAAGVREALPDSVVVLLRESRIDDRTVMLIAYAKELYDVKFSMVKILKDCACVERFGVSAKVKNAEQLPIAYAQASILLTGTSDVDAGVKLHDFAESETGAQLMECIRHGEPDKVLEHLRHYVDSLERDSPEQAIYKPECVKMLLACRKRLSDEHREYMSVHIEALLDDIDAPRDSWIGQFSTELTGFIEQLQTNQQHVQPSCNIESMRSYLQEQCQCADFTVQKMAEYFEMSPAALNTYFKNKAGVTVTQYYTDIKMELARNLLKTTDIPVYEIGLKLGYYGPNSFIRRFKQLTGMTPGEYRDTCTLQEGD